MSGSRPKFAVLLSTALAGGVLLAAYAGGNQHGSRGLEIRPTGPGRHVSGGPSGASGRSEAVDDGARASAQSGSTSSSAESGKDAGSTSLGKGSGGSSSTLSQSSNDGISNFSGTGPVTVTFRVAERSRLAWTSAGEAFSVLGSGISVHSRRGLGEVAIDAGDYDKVRIDGAAWTVNIQPR